VNVVDSSAWLEYLGDGPNAQEFAAAIEDPDSLVVPTIVLLEVFKRLALDAAMLSAEFGLPMADSVILATAQAKEAILWKQDAHFRGLPNVEFREKR